MRVSGSTSVVNSCRRQRTSAPGIRKPLGSSVFRPLLIQRPAVTTNGRRVCRPGALHDRGASQEYDLDGDDGLYSGVGWVSEQQAALVAEDDVDLEEERMPREVDESSPLRQPFHQRLLLAAEKGRPDLAARVLVAMAEAGLEPGPRAWHGVVYAHCKAGDGDGALDVMRDAYQQGLQPLPESYVALVRCFAQAGEADRAERVLLSMLRSGLDGKPGWLMLTKQLFRHGQADLALELVDLGRTGLLVTTEENGLEGQPGHPAWEIDADQLEEIIRHSPSRKEAEMDAAWSRDLPGCKVTARHLNALLEDRQAGTYNLDLMFQKWTSQPYSIAPDADTINRLLEAFLYEVKSGVDAQEESGQELYSKLMGYFDTYRLRPNRNTLALTIAIATALRDPSRAMKAFDGMRRSDDPRLALKALGDEDFAAFVEMLVQQQLPVQLARVLRAMKSDGRRLPTCLCSNSQKRPSFITSWLEKRLTTLRQQSGEIEKIAGKLTEENYQEGPEVSSKIVEVEVRDKSGDAIKIEHSVVVDKDNTVMEERDVFEKQGKSRVVVGTEWKAKRLGAMKKEDFLAELILRGISTEVIPENMQREDAHTGRVVKEVDQLKRRVKAARKAAEQSAEATLLKMQMKEVKKNVQRRKGAELRLSERRANESRQLPSARREERQSSGYTVVAMIDGKVVKEEEKAGEIAETVVMTEKENPMDVELRQIAERNRHEGEYDPDLKSAQNFAEDDENDDDDDKVWVEGDEQVEPMSSAKTVETTDETAGVAHACKLLSLATSLSGKPTLGDIDILCRGATAEKDAEAALEIANYFQKQWVSLSLDKVGASRLQQLLDVCVDAQSEDALAVMSIMDDLGVDVDRNVREKVEAMGDESIGGSDASLAQEVADSEGNGSIPGGADDSDEDEDEAQPSEQ